jgi:hypothetical protein
VDDLITLVTTVNSIIQSQAQADTAYFGEVCGRRLAADRLAQAHAALLAAYRWQYIVSGAQNQRFNQVLGSMLTPEQRLRLQAALTPLAG